MAEEQSPEASQQSAQSVSKDRMEQIHRIDAMVDDLASQHPDSASSARKVKKALKEWMVQLVQESSSQEVAAPRAAA